MKKEEVYDLWLLEGKKETKKEEKIPIKFKKKLLEKEKWRRKTKK